MIEKKYQIIYADPPRSYKDKALSWNRGACCKYDVMGLEAIKSLPVPLLADKDCVLFMWVTMPKLNECFEVIKSWWFEYKTCAFTRVKRNKISSTWFMWMGRWTRANAEICLLATKWSPKRISASVLSIIDTPIEQHSKKPSIVREKIVQLLWDIPRVELFAREKVAWRDSWGNEIESDFTL